MSAKPILVLQLQRMGDLVLSFPLLAWLGRHLPGHPLWVVGEEIFFKPLMPLSPSVTYFSYSNAHVLRGHEFHMVINLSHRPEAAALAGTVGAERVIGPYRTPNGSLHIGGNWQLYRASLTHNNRYNLFHWADLNALDCIPPVRFRTTRWPLPRKGKPQPNPAPPKTAPATAPQALPKGAPDASAAFSAEGLPTGQGHIGLFLGASEEGKRPDAPFWASLARQLLHEGARPVLLGGPAESGLGVEVSRLLKTHALNLCGRFSVEELACFIAGLDLLVTPDTGPMHVATWTETPVLNLSLGPVNPWETGPFSPGHHVLRAAVPCLGCWVCQEAEYLCKKQMPPRQVAAISLAIASGEPAHSRAGVMRGIALYSTRRSGLGLFELAELLPSTEGSPDTLEIRRILADKEALGRFWQQWFLARFGLTPPQGAQDAATRLANEAPHLVPLLQSGLTQMLLTLSRSMKKNPAELLTREAWEKCPQIIRPFSGFAELFVQNENADKQALVRVLADAEELVRLMQG